ncbi:MULTISPECIES: DUF447 domain-containing protein [Methylobacterium]|uniref:Tetrahydromethanopterin synthesis protein n=2 Tax=Pseudomonadota TaxID=1224 RepID=A0ABQ4SZZ9_9HYPH|nr:MULTISPECIES: DUF447 domain-containing protein [Methylobacterium]PIU07812.1 MAG: DUF447 domain-containing protein [Methylobacterium sp. CG09_land_8_20_14_0_10_71_15]PIU13195.1 MAG: DUF447 domain-containing protein [Methylobacterium sp. CG08_land_8_20_14_0_20_71_15]GBU15969.1 hypothetical protein AwMethylo_01840 [Methylobacterium sp.]GJE08068.1 hypothetical protein AOPFMNJM_3402 [Methylobacterium jeotgali]
MPLILETIVTTRSAEGRLHLVPFGLIREDDGATVLAPFRPSPTIQNLAVNPVFAVSSPRDVRVIAGAVTGRRDWPVLPCARIDGARLADSFGHAEFEVEAVEDDATRPRYRGRLVHEAAHAPFLGYNRAQGAVLEAAILSTRLHMLEPEKILSEMRYLAIAVSKTAGPREREAWNWIEDKVAAAIGPGARVLDKPGAA